MTIFDNDFLENLKQSLIKCNTNISQIEDLQKNLAEKNTTSIENILNNTQYIENFLYSIIPLIEKYLQEQGYEDHIIDLEDSSATVQLAAEALGVEPGMIAKTLSFLVSDTPILILAEGTARVDNHKYKDTFHTKAKMSPFDDVEEFVGQERGGGRTVSIKEGMPV